MKDGRGWFNDSKRHADAARGIKTAKVHVIDTTYRARQKLAMMRGRPDEGQWYFDSKEGRFYYVTELDEAATFKDWGGKTVNRGARIWYKVIDANGRVLVHKIRAVKGVEKLILDGVWIPAEPVKGVDWSAPYLDSMGVRVKDVKLATGLDAGIADILQAVNDTGFSTAQSMSGMKADYRGKGAKRYSNDGYLGFWLDKLKEGQAEEIERAGKKAKMYVGYSDIYFSPAISVRTGKLKSGAFHGDVLEKANRLAGLKIDAPDFLKRLHERDRIMKRLVREGDGWVEDDKEIAKMWEVFTKELTGKNVRALL